MERESGSWAATPGGAAPASSGDHPLRQAAGQVTDQAGQTAEQVAESARQAVSTGLAGGKQWVTGNLDAMAEGLRQARDGLDQQGQGLAGTVLERLAGSVERAAEYLEGREVDDLRWELEDFARRQPGMFLAGAFALGLAAARFLKSTGPRTRTYYGDGSGRGHALGPLSSGYPGGGAYTSITDAASASAPIAAGRFAPPPAAFPSPAGRGAGTAASWGGRSAPAPGTESASAAYAPPGAGAAVSPASADLHTPAEGSAAGMGGAGDVPPGMGAVPPPARGTTATGAALADLTTGADEDNGGDLPGSITTPPGR